MAADSPTALIDKAARAIFKRRMELVAREFALKNPDVTVVPTVDWASMPERQREMEREMARAALEAVGMLEARLDA
jgi:hypothetical protein